MMMQIATEGCNHKYPKRVEQAYVCLKLLRVASNDTPKMLLTGFLSSLTGEILQDLKELHMNGSFFIYRFVELYCITCLGPKVGESWVKLEGILKTGFFMCKRPTFVSPQ